MNARVAAGVLLALGTLDLGVLNLVLVPRLSSRSAAVEARPEPVAETRPAAEVRPAAPPPRAEAATDIWATTRAPVATPKRAVHATQNVIFAFDSARLEHLDTILDLRRLARELAAEPDRKLLLRGHADPLGFPGQNVELSQRRAEAVKSYLVLRGAPADRIVIEAIGSTEPADPLQTPGAWAKDRRVEVLWR